MNQPLDGWTTCLYYSQVHLRNQMVTPSNRSIIDEIRDEIQLDNIYRRLETNRRVEDYDFYDDQPDYEYTSEYF